MSDSFLNNQEVTEEDLNQIAIDLGYAEYSHFPEDPPQSAVSALNQITGDLTGAGLLMIGNRCKASLSGNIISVQDGVCVFANGAKKRLESAVSIDYIPDTTNYIYFLNDTAGNKISLINSSEMPAVSDDYVMLATIQDKKVIDKRKLSTSKVADFGSHPIMDVSATYTIGKTKVPAGDPIVSFDIGEGYTRAILTTSSKNHISIYNFETRKWEKSMFARYDGDYQENELTIHEDTLFGNIYLAYVDGIVSICSTEDVYMNVGAWTKTFYLTIF